MINDNILYVHVLYACMYVCTYIKLQLLCCIIIYVCMCMDKSQSLHFIYNFACIKINYTLRQSSTVGFSKGGLM